MLSQFFIRKFIAAMEAGVIPDFLIRSGIRYLLQQRLKEMVLLQAKYQGHYLSHYANQLSQFPLAVLTKKANEQHYEVPTEFYDMCLGHHKKYSSCYWEDKVNNLNTAEQAALDISIARAQINDGDRILEIGCGWGSLSLELAKRFPKSRITAVSNSTTQKKYIDDIARARGLVNLEVLTRDMGLEESYNFNGEMFDRIMSIEMMEHLRNYEKFFYLVSRLMKPGAKFFVHVFTHKSTPYFFETEGDDNWMGKYFFSGGQMPAKYLFMQFNQHLQVTHNWDWNGAHYQKTLDAWLNKMDAHAPQVRAVFAKQYGYQDAVLWINRWRVFFMACSELFGFKNGTEWSVTHYLLEKKHD